MGLIGSSVCSSPLDRTRAGARDLEADDIDRVLANLHALARRCRKPGADETGQHPAAEVMADDEEFLLDAASTACEHL